MIEQMRTDFADAARWEEWSADDQAEIGAVLRQAIADNAEEALAYWAWRLGAAAEEWRRWRARVRQAEERMRQARETRAA